MGPAFPRPGGAPAKSTRRARAAVQMLNSAWGAAPPRSAWPARRGRLEVPAHRTRSPGNFAASGWDWRLQGSRRANRRRWEQRRREAQQRASPARRLPRAPRPLALGPLRQGVSPAAAAAGDVPPAELVSRGLHIHHRADRRAKFTSSAVNPWRTERRPQEGSARPSSPNNAGKGLRRGTEDLQTPLPTPIM